MSGFVKRWLSVTPVLFLFAVAAEACVVERDFVDQELFFCDTNAQCGPGWGCVKATPYASDFCAESCNSNNCDGVCVSQDDGSYCLRGCRIREDGTTSECPADGYSCIRLGVDRDEGVCYPVESCRATADCDANEICLSEITDGADNLYCIPVPDEMGMCPARSIAIPFEDGTEMCLATCETGDRRCPPSFACLFQYGLLGSSMPLPCFPGIYGLSCDDDTNCLVGRCLDTGGPGKVCTVTCEDAQVLTARGCPGLGGFGILDFYTLECDESAGGGVGGGLCAPRYTVGSICTPDSSMFTCAQGLTCRELELSSVPICTRDCTDHLMCNTGNEVRNFCLQQGPMSPGICLPRFSEGAQCSQNVQCQSGMCVMQQCAASVGPSMSSPTPTE